MEANIKENQITFSKGMSNVPSDNLCDDNCLSDCIGLRMKDGELKAVQNPASLITGLGGTLMYVHKTPGYKHYIYYSSGLYYRDDETGNTNPINISSATAESGITSIGNTLIVNTSEGLSYAVWRNDGYKVIDSLPDVSVSVRSYGGSMLMPEDYSDSEMKNAMYLLQKSHNYRQSDTDADSAKQEIVGLIEKGYKKALSIGNFMFPFWIRVALKLYDGSYAMISPPVLAFPSVRRSAFVMVEYQNSQPYMMFMDRATDMQIKLLVNGSFDGLEDIVDSVSIFLSDQVKTWEDTGSGGSFTPDYDNVIYDYIDSNGKYQSLTSKTGQTANQGHYGRADVVVSPNDESVVDCYYMPPYELTDEEIIENLINTSVFYKIADIKPGAPVFSKYKEISSLMKRHVLENLTTQEQLPHDDYYGHCKYKAKYMYAFNNRLQIADVERIPWQGKYDVTSQDASTTWKWNVNLRINGRDGYMYPVVQVGRYDVAYAPCFFFYPDPNADRATFITDSSPVNMILKAHPRLNGAYYFACLPPNHPSSDGEYISGGTVGSEKLNTTVMTSEVNNPWVFNAEGDNTVGTGEIIGVVSNTRALSQGQFGEHPLIVFTSEGIYALGTNSEGLYSTNYPLSREVCNNPKSITPTDGAVFFTSEKGLMMMVGSELTCVSQQMMGKTNDFNPNSLYGTTYKKEQLNFHDFLKECVIAYDYRDSCLHIINTAKQNGNNVFEYHYVYDIKSGAITRSSNREEYLRVVNDYPDNLLQDSNGTVWSLINKPEPNADDTSYNGILLSRPCKMSDAQTLKSLRQVMHIMDMHDGASVTLHIYVSNDLKHWGEVKSLRGMGWKYFRFGLAFSNLKATDSYSGLLAITQNRRTDKLR